MKDHYITVKTKEIMLCFNTIVDINHREKFIKLILEATWLGGKVEGVQEAREILK